MRVNFKKIKAPLTVQGWVYKVTVSGGIVGEFKGKRTETFTLFLDQKNMDRLAERMCEQLDSDCIEESERK